MMWGTSESDDNTRDVTIADCLVVILQSSLYRKYYFLLEWYSD
jgi:hypothetical protein